MIPVSVVIIARNEEAKLPRLLKSIDFTDDIVVVDSDSTDATVDIARRHGCRCFNREFDGFGPQKRYAVAQASHDWVLVLDADEEVSPPLAAQLQRIDLSQLERVYRIQRRSFYLGRWIKHTDWSKDRPLRLFHRATGCVTEDNVHETVSHTGKEVILKGPLLHYPFRDLAHHLAKIDLYTGLSAAAGNHHYHSWDLFTRPFWKVFRNLVLRSAWLDGWQGLTITGMSALYAFLKVSRCLEAERCE